MSSTVTVISARWVVPVNASRDVLENHAVVIDGEIIKAVLPVEQAKQDYADAQWQELGDFALIPGLVNAHGHAAMVYLRGFADDLPLMTWLNDHIWPAEGQFAHADFCRDGTELAIAEMLRSGTTCYSDNYFFPEACIDTIRDSGIRAQLNFPILDFPTNWAQSADEYIDKGFELIKAHKEDKQIQVIFGPHAPYTVSDEPFKRIVELANEHDVLIQMHVHETQFEVDDQSAQKGQRPIRRLKELGILGPHMQCVHMTALNDQDIADIVETGAHVVHCPESNLKLASGFCPVDKLQKAGVNVCIGTDGAASNNDLDMFGEMRTAAQLAKAVSQNAEALPAYEALAAATINGAKAMQRENEFGSLEAGKFADMIAVDLSDIESMPIYDPVSHLVYATTRNQVSHVWVAGKALLQNGELTTLDKAAIIAKAKEWQAKIKGA